MDNLQVFNFNANEVRIVMINDKPWFVLKDVCDALELMNQKHVSDRLDEDEVGTSDVPHPQNVQKTLSVTVVSESGLYNIILRSDKPEAKQFKRWVIHEVLPSIRNTGSYNINKTFKLPQTYLEALECLVISEKEKLVLQEENTQQTKLIEEQEPLVKFAEHVTNSSDCISIGELSKVAKNESINIGQNRLFQFLRDHEILMGTNLPYQKYLNKNWFSVIEVAKKTAYGDKVFQKTLVTGKGQVEIIELLNQFYVA